MTSRMVTKYGFICLFALVLTLPFAHLRDINDDDSNVERRGLQHSKTSHLKTRHRNSNTNQNVNTNDNSAIKNLSKIQKKKLRKIHGAMDHTFRRSMNMEDKSSRIKIKESSTNVDHKIKDIDRLLKNLHTAEKFRENVVRAFGYLLQVAGNTSLTEEQFSALHLIYTVLQEKRIDFFDLLPPLQHFLSEEVSKGKDSEIEMLLKIISKNLPKYLRCTAHFLVKEFHDGAISVSNIISKFQPPENTFNIFKDIDMNQMNKTIFDKDDILKLQVPGNDTETKITENALGPIFVNIIDNLQDKTLSLTQELFGTILMRMPISPMDPVLEENIKYISNLALNNQTPHWSDINISKIDKNPYDLILHTVSSLLKAQKEDYNIIDSLMYILNHLKPPLKNHLNPQYEDMAKMIQNNSLYDLFNSIATPQFDSETMENSRLLGKIINETEPDKKYINSTIDVFAYSNPFDVLLGILTKLQKSLDPKKNNDQLMKVLSYLLPTMIFKKENSRFPSQISKDLYITDILPIIVQEGNQTLDNVIKIIQQTVEINKPSNSIVDIIPKDNQVCEDPLSCLSKALEIISVELPKNNWTDIKKSLKDSIQRKEDKKNKICPPEEENRMEPPVKGPKRIIPKFPNLPIPKTSQDMLNQIKLISILNNRNYLNREDLIDKVINNQLPPDDLYDLLLKILTTKVAVLTPEDRAIIDHYLDLLIRLNLIPTILVHQEGVTKEVVKVELSTMLREVLDFPNLPLPYKISFAVMMKYIENHHDLLQLVNLFEFEQKGPLARFILTELSNNPIVDEFTREKMKSLIPKVTLTGVGAEKVNITKNKTKRT